MHLKGKTNKEIAEALGTTVSTVWKHKKDMGLAGETYASQIDKEME